MQRKKKEAVTLNRVKKRKKPHITCVTKQNRQTAGKVKKKILTD